MSTEADTNLDRSIIRLFGDIPLRDICPLSFHSLVGFGHVVDKPVGEWFGPASIATVIKLVIVFSKILQHSQLEHLYIFHSHIYYTFFHHLSFYSLIIFYLIYLLSIQPCIIHRKAIKKYKHHSSLLEPLFVYIAPDSTSLLIIKINNTIILFLNIFVISSSRSIIEFFSILNISNPSMYQYY